MCGIAGLIRPRGAGRDLAGTVAAMTAALTHRGPDHGGLWTDLAAGVGLGHRRLAILDLSPSGHQPMVSTSGRLVLTYNGEIYNCRELRRELESRGVGFRGSSDSEVLLAALERFGVDGALARIAGMFAFALWDRQHRRLTLARDHLGIKPLYWAHEADELAFASELRGLAARPLFSPVIDRDALAAYARWNYVPAPHAIFEGVRKLRPGHLVSLDRHGRLEERPFWRLAEVVRERTPARAARPNEPEALAGLRAVLTETVRQQMAADVPLGALLSGGVDSSAVVALMQAASPRPVATFTIGYDDPAFDEASQARAVAAWLGTAHHELHVSAQDAMAAITRLPEIYDEPFADSSQIPTALVAAFAGSRVKVCLTGDGGDELFAGYDRYRWAAAVRHRLGWLPAPLRRAAAGALGALPSRLWQAALGWHPGRRQDGTRLAERIARLGLLLAADGEAALYRSGQSRWPAPEALVTGGAEPDDLAWAAVRDMPLSFVGRQQAADLLRYVPDDLLTKLDRASMAVGLEARVPLLDHRVVEYYFGLPDRLKRRGRGKYLLRRLLYEHVPAALIDRPKRGFRAPLASWLRTSLRDWRRICSPRNPCGGRDCSIPRSCDRPGRPSSPAPPACRNRSGAC
jgi:asparagine synthase (glutamine-hydrolysing)